MSTRTSWVQGATGAKQYHWTTPQQVNLGSKQVTHSFLVVPDCPVPLLGRDLLSKVQAHIHFGEKEIQLTDGSGHPIQVLTVALQDEYRLYQQEDEKHQVPQDMELWLQEYPQALAETAGIGLAKHRPSLIVELKPSATPVRVRQYPMPSQARRGIAPHIQRLLREGILRKCRSL